MKHLREFTIVILIILVATIFRLYKLDTFPPGLYPDEAMNGNNAIQAYETGEYKIFYPENNGREGLFIAIQSLSIRAFGNTAYALRFVSAITGILTVLGLYFLAKKLFNWQIGAIASFLMAISFWHVTFSRIGFRAIMAPLLVVWGAYFFWKGLSTTRWQHFAISAIFWGLGFYTYISFRVMPGAIIAALLAYWYAIKKDFSHDRYIHARNRITQGLAVFMLVGGIVIFPLAYHFYLQPEDFLGRITQVSIFSQDSPLKILATNFGKTLGIFNFVGDHNWRHNFAGRPILFLPVGIFFILGFFKSILRLEKSRKMRGHFSPPHVFLFSWFFLGLLPVVLSAEGIPHSLRAIVVVPVIYIFTAEGLWWIFEWSRDHYRVRSRQQSYLPLAHHHIAQSTLAISLALGAFLLADAIYEFKTYFYDWGPNETVRANFNQNYVDIADRLNALPRIKVKYVLVNAGGTLVNGIPMPAQTVMYLTDTWTSEKQQAKNIFYLNMEQYAQRRYLPNAIIIPLEEKK